MLVLFLIHSCIYTDERPSPLERQIVVAQRKAISRDRQDDALPATVPDQGATRGRAGCRRAKCCLRARNKTESYARRLFCDEGVRGGAGRALRLSPLPTFHPNIQSLCDVSTSRPRATIAHTKENL
jgi:hypothetical protein